MQLQIESSPISARIWTHVTTYLEEFKGEIGVKEKAIFRTGTKRKRTQLTLCFLVWFDFTTYFSNDDLKLFHLWPSLSCSIIT